MSNLSSPSVFETIRTPAIAFLTTLTAFAAYRQQAEGFTPPIDDLDHPDAEAARSDFEFDADALTTRGTVALPETQSPQSLAQLKARLNQTLANRSTDVGLELGAAEINSTIEQTRLQRQHQDYLRTLLGRSSQSASSNQHQDYLQSLLGSRPQSALSNPTALTTGTSRRPIVTVSALPPLPTTLPAQPTVRHANSGVINPTQNLPTMRATQASPQPETQAKQPQFSRQAIALAASSPSVSANTVPSRAATVPTAAAKPETAPAIAAQVSAADLAMAETAPAIAGQYHFTDRLQVQPNEVLTAAADPVLADPALANQDTLEQAATCVAHTIDEKLALALFDPEAAVDAAFLAESAIDGTVEPRGLDHSDELALTDAANLSNKAVVCEDDTSVLAQSMPEAATAGTPMPGSVLSPTR